MNREEMIKLAEQVGDDWENMPLADQELLIRYAALIEERAAAAEREACAKAVEIFDRTFQTGGGIAGSIRARGDK